MSALQAFRTILTFSEWWPGATFGILLVAMAPAHAEIVRTAVFGSGTTMSQGECDRLPQAVWVAAAGHNFCIRYYQSIAGGEGAKPVVFLQGDFLETKEESTDDLFKYADRISRNARTTGLYLARVGRDGSSGSHDLRHSMLELLATNAALDAIKQKYGFAGFHLYGHSGGAILVGGLLRFRSDIACAVLADGRLDGARKAKLPDPNLRDYNLVDSIAIIARNRSARILVVTDPQDKDILNSEQSPFVEKLRQAGGQVDQYFVDSGGFDPTFHHFTTPHAEVVIRDCIHGASHNETAADLADLVAKSFGKVGPNSTAGKPSTSELRIGVPLADIDLHGADYASFSLASADPSQCQRACQSDTKCAAWTYVHPGVQGNMARCWLKDNVPPQSRSTCCVSGLEGRQ